MNGLMTAACSVPRDRSSFATSMTLRTLAFRRPLYRPEVLRRMLFHSPGRLVVRRATRSCASLMLGRAPRRSAAPYRHIELIT